MREIFQRSGKLITQKPENDPYAYCAQCMRQAGKERNSCYFLHAPIFFSADCQYRQPVIRNHCMQQAQ